jgi:SAM-dependent methyltransferase
MTGRWDASAADAVAAQTRYYDLYASDYVNPLAPSNHRVPRPLGPTAAADLIDHLAPSGDVLELACGAGGFTAELSRHATTVTALDASAQMLARNRIEVDRRNVTYVQADVFEWRPDQRYDLVFFGFWLSHIPPVRFDDFWYLLRTCLRDGGHVAFVDEDDRSSSNDKIRIEDGVPLAARRLPDGRTLDVIKVFWKPDALTARLHSLGWTFNIQRFHDIFMYGEGRLSRD